MYKCGTCGMGIMVKDLPEPIRLCKCTRIVERKPSTKLEKFLSFFGKKYFITKPSVIVCGMEGHAKGSSQFNA